MATKTITRVYSTYEQAAEIVRKLEAADISHRDISIVSSNSNNTHAGVREYVHSDPKGTERENVYETAVGGGIVGGVSGLLAGLGLVLIPGFGPVAAAGWFAAMLAGATIGTATATGAEAIAEAFSSSGVDKATANQYAERVRLGGTLVAVRTDDSKAGLVDSILGLDANDTILGDTTDRLDRAV